MNDSLDCLTRVNNKIIEFMNEYHNIVSLNIMVDPNNLVVKVSDPNSYTMIGYICHNKISIPDNLLSQDAIEELSSIQDIILDTREEYSKRVLNIKGYQ